MALNLSSSDLGVLITSSFPSCSGCPASNALVDAPERVWLSDPDTATLSSTTTSNAPTTSQSMAPYTPQSLILDFNQLSQAQPSVVIHTAGIYCWHNYSSNPKVVSIHVSSNGIDFVETGKYIHQGKPSAGLILFALDKPIQLQLIRYIRFDFEETYGGNQVYVNRLHMYESTPDVVKLFIDEDGSDIVVDNGNGNGNENEFGNSTDRNGNTYPNISTPATNEAHSMLGVRIDDSLAKLQESLVYQYSSGLDDSLDDALGNKQNASRHIDERNENRNENENENDKEDPGFGVHLHRSGSMDIHIPSSIANGMDGNSTVRIHGGHGSKNGIEVGVNGMTTTRNHSSSSPSPSTSSSSSSFGNEPQLSSWAISQAVRTPLSDQLHDMCLQVANLADKRGIHDHNLRTLHPNIVTKETTKETKKETTKETETIQKNTPENKKKRIQKNKMKKSNKDTDVLYTLETSLRNCANQASSLEERVAFVENEMLSLKQLMHTVLERTGINVPITTNMNTTTKTTQHKTTMSLPSSSTTPSSISTLSPSFMNLNTNNTNTTNNPSNPNNTNTTNNPSNPNNALDVLGIKRIVVDSLKRWEKDMVTSVFDPSIRSAIKKLEIKINRKISTLDEGRQNKYTAAAQPSTTNGTFRVGVQIPVVNKEKEEKEEKEENRETRTTKTIRATQQSTTTESQTAWAVGANMRTMQVTSRGMLPASPKMIEQQVLVSRLKDKMEAKAKTLRLIEHLQKSNFQEEVQRMTVSDFKGGDADLLDRGGQYKAAVQASTTGETFRVGVKIPVVNKQEEDEAEKIEV